jgi:hypothetical protein
VRENDLWQPAILLSFAWFLPVYRQNEDGYRWLIHICVQ